MMWCYLFLVSVLPATVLCRSVTPFIVGGVQSAEGAWPWQLSLRFGRTHSCGASLLGGKYGVTAAHCVGGPVALYDVIAGTNNQTCLDDNCVSRSLDTIVRHPDYIDSGSSGYPSDVAVITWSPLIVWSAGKIEYVGLATVDNGTAQSCFVTGWGRLTDGGTIPDMLYEANIDLLSTAECQNLWSTELVSDKQICAFDQTNQQKSTCNGDPGGPLVCQVNFASPWELVGVISWGASGCNPAYPSVCSRITYYRDWIVEQQPGIGNYTEWELDDWS